MKITPIEEPYNEHELSLIRKIEELQREYQDRAKPYVDALVSSRATHPVRYIVMPEPGDIDHIPTATKEMLRRIDYPASDMRDYPDLIQIIVDEG